MIDELFENLTDIDENSDNTNKYLTFLSNDLIYGIKIENVTEIITNYSITKLPMVPNYVQGIINLRGQIIPVVDIRLRMNKLASETPYPCIIIIEINSISIGILVDSVLQVLNLENKIAAPPSKNQEFISGITNLPDGSVMFYLDCDLLVNTK